LSQGLHGVDKDGKHYLARYYDPLSTPVLYRLADAGWVRWLFGPLVSWWYPIATKSGESWHRLQGGALTLPKGANPYAYPGLLVFSEELWEALESDPLPYRLTYMIAEENPEIFEHECYGVRVAQVEALLDEARRQGLTQQPDLVTYVMIALAEKSPRYNVRLQDAIRRVTRRKMSLEEAYFGSRALENKT
jgi:hypothetical protein